MRLKKLAYKKEPVWHNQKWAVAIHNGFGKCSYFYGITKKDILAMIKTHAKPGDVVEIFKANFNFVQAAERVR